MSADPDFWGLNGGVDAARKRLRQLQDDARRWEELALKRREVEALERLAGRGGRQGRPRREASADYRASALGERHMTEEEAMQQQCIGCAGCAFIGFMVLVLSLPGCKP